MVISAKGIPYKNKDFWVLPPPPMSPGAGNITTWGYNFWRSEMRRQVSPFLGTQTLGVPIASLETCKDTDQLLRASLSPSTVVRIPPRLCMSLTDPGQILPWDARATAVRLITIHYSELPRRSSQLK